MQRKDLGVVIAVGVFATIVSFIVSNVLISTDENRNQRAEVVEAINSEFQRPDNTYFNDQSVNPTQDIQLDEDPNENPFGNN